MNDSPKSLAERKVEMDAIAAQVSVCTRCPLHVGRTRAVPGAGPADSAIMFIGEGPGYHEDQQGLPFVGQSGKYLEELLATIGLNRTQVFIGNVVKCRPPENRDPLPKEIEICTTLYLYRQIELISPKVIVTLGRHSMGLFLPGAKITQVHGQARWKDDRAILPLFHPAAVLRNPELRTAMAADFKKIPDILAEYDRRLKGKPTAGEPPAPSDPPKQLNLF